MHGNEVGRFTIGGEKDHAGRLFEGFWSADEPHVLEFRFHAAAAGDAHAPKLKQMDWPFDGVFGKMDKPSVQRGLQVYKEVCASCHSLKRVAFRSLQDIGLSEAEVASFAAGYTVQDGPNDAGEMFERAGRPADMFPHPFPNDNAARAANGGANVTYSASADAVDMAALKEVTEGIMAVEEVMVDTIIMAAIGMVIMFVGTMELGDILQEELLLLLQQ